MVDPIALTWFRGRRWVLTTLLSAAGLVLVAAPASARQDDQEPATSDQAEPPRTEDEAVEIEQQDLLEDSVFLDPVAKQAMSNTFEELYRSSRSPTNARLQIEAMARGRSSVDPAAIDRYIKSAARELTDHGNIDAIMAADGRSDPRRVEDFEQAGLNLMSPYVNIPSEQRDRRFYQEYNGRLLEVAPELLDNHLFARTQAMLALDRMGDPDALDLLIEQLKNPQQPSVVKMLAAQGIGRIARESGSALTPSLNEQAAQALIGFVRENPDAFWLAKARALEALGELRQISGILNREEAAHAVAALEFLIDERFRVETRAFASWALGMFDVPAEYPQVNYSLISYHVGRLAETLGQRIVELSDEGSEAFNPERAAYLTGVLVTRVFASLEGSRELRNSGLRNARSIGPHRDYVLRVHQLVKQLSAASVELSRAVQAQRGPRRRQLAARLEELRTFLDQNPPQDATLVPGTREFEVAASASTATSQ